MKGPRLYYQLMGWIFVALLVLGLEAAVTIEITQRARTGVDVKPGLGTQKSQLK